MLALVGNNLLAICEDKTQPVYVGKGRVLDLSGNEIVGRSSELLTLGNEFQKDLGTRDPATIIADEGFVYGYDRFKRVVWRYTQGSGQFDIGGFGMGNEILELDPSQTAATGGLNREHGTYHVTINGKTYVFQEGSSGQEPRWVGNASFTPEYYAYLGLDMITFKDGQFWIHNNPIRCNFYGEQFDAGLSFSCNEDNIRIKLFESIEVEASAKVYSPLILSLPNSSYPDGMQSQLIASKWGLYEGRHKADFLRDELTPYKEFTDIADPVQRQVTALLKGRPLRGDTLTVRLRLVAPGTQGVFSAAFISFAYSFATV
jgi:hypothetical protein